MVTFQLSRGGHFLEFFSHKYLKLVSPRGIALLKVVSGQNPREIAVEVLQRRGFVEDTLENFLAKAHLSPADRRLCQELVYGVVRRQATLDWLVERKTQGRVQKPLLQNVLRLGLYQIFWLSRIPNHAAVNETVEIAKRKGFHSQAGFINAVLRGYLREFDATRSLLDQLRQSDPALGYSHPVLMQAPDGVSFEVPLPTRVDVIGCQGGNICDQGVIESVRGMISDGVNVMFPLLNVISLPRYLSEMTTQGVKPGQIQFYNTDYNAQSGDLVSSKVVKFGGAKAGALYNNAVIISSGQTGAFRLPNFKPSAFGEMCNREYQAAGGAKYTADDPATNSAYGATSGTCAFLRIIARAIDNAGPNPKRETA